MFALLEWNILPHTILWKYLYVDFVLVPQALSMATANPFAGVAPSPPPNLFQQQQIRPSINQIRQQPFGGNVTQAQGSTESAWGPAPNHRPVLPTPLLPSAQPNPFLS